MAKIFVSEGRYVKKESVEYRGVRFVCRGTSKRGRTEARRSFDRNLAEKKKQIDISIDGPQRAEHDTLGNALMKWHEAYLANDGRTQKTISRDISTIRLIAKSDIGMMPVDSLTADSLQEFLMSKRDYSASQLKKVHSMLKRYLEYADMEDIVKKLKLPKSRRVSVAKTAYSDSEMERLEEALREPYDPSVHKGPRGFLYGNMLVVCMYLYLRSGELIELRVKDVTLKGKGKNRTGYVTVSRQYRYETNEIRPPKYNSVRNVPIDQRCMDIIVDACAGKEPDELLFPAGKLNRRGVQKERHVLQKELLRVLATACDNSGLDCHTVHDLRHDGISRLVRRNVTAASVSKWAGHKSISTTLDRYCRQTGNTGDDMFSRDDLDKMNGESH